MLTEFADYLMKCSRRDATRLDATFNNVDIYLKKNNKKNEQSGIGVETAWLCDSCEAPT